MQAKPMLHRSACALLSRHGNGTDDAMTVNERMRRFSTVSSRYSPRRRRFPAHFASLHQNRFNSTQRPCFQALSIASILQELRELNPLQQAHAHIVTSGLAHDIFLSNILMNSYASCGLTTDAKQIFGRIIRKNVVSWTILISGFAKNGLFMDAVDVFRKMVIGGLKPNAVTVASVLPALAHLGLTQIGRSVHCFWIRHLFEANLIVETSLIDMYSRYGSMTTARCLFDKMPERNVASWNVIIWGYSNNDIREEAIWLFNLMRRKGFIVDFFTVMSVISACSLVGDSQLGTGFHGFLITTGFENDQLIKTALIDIYVNGNNVNDAYRIFNEMSFKDVAAWTQMLNGFSTGQCWNQAMEHFNEMMGLENMKLDCVAFTCILSSCSRSGALQHGMRIHGLALRLGFINDCFVGSALIDMYANCGSLVDARKIFEVTEEKDVVCWNAMISGNGMFGYGNKAIDLFMQMKGAGINPNESTFVCVLSACSHAGMVDEGLYLFYHMVSDWHIVPDSHHYACVVDLLSRAGRLDDAKSLINIAPFRPDFGVYGALLGACRVYGNIEMGVEISQKIFELEPNDAGYYVLLSNMYSLAGSWEGVEMTRASLRSRGLKKDPGFTSIEINRHVYTFMAGQKDHPQYYELDTTLRHLIKIKEAGYVPDLDSVFQDVSDDNQARNNYSDNKESPHLQ